ncbi:hypothetical protein BgAZ_208320 [Babesia gibsoni]|uniref:C3H1-type domain-containing protein n=1 Tax=Babesia gibsoni TaxID=33632 RepID=A0AAD8PEN3_BABGI|nr:hypothetical protein BgAZ_208320 [Babesia gibsoni]
MSVRTNIGSGTATNSNYGIDELRLPMSLSDYMEQQLVRDKIRRALGDREADSIDMLRRYMEDLKFQDVDSTICSIMNGVSHSSSSTLAKRSPPINCHFSYNDQSNYTKHMQWSNFQQHQSVSSSDGVVNVYNHLSQDIIAPPRETFQNRYQETMACPPTYYDKPPEMRVEELQYHNNTGNAGNFSWKMIWESNALRKNVRMRPSRDDKAAAAYYGGPESSGFPGHDWDQYSLPSLNLTNSATNSNKLFSIPEENRSVNRTVRVADDLVPQKKQVPNSHARTSLCKFWQRGACNRDNCNFAHGQHELKSTIGIWKTTICHHWKHGVCLNGDKCRHAHGEEELQPRNYNINMKGKKMHNERFDYAYKYNTKQDNASRYNCNGKLYNAVKDKLSTIKTLMMC